MVEQFHGYTITQLPSNYVTEPKRKSKSQQIMDAKINAVNRTNRVHFTSNGKAILPNRIILPVNQH